MMSILTTAGELQVGDLLWHMHWRVTPFTVGLDERPKNDNVVVWVIQRLSDGHRLAAPMDEGRPLHVNRVVNAGKFEWGTGTPIVWEETA